MIVEYQEAFKEVENIKDKVDSVIREAKEKGLIIKNISLDQHQIKAFMKQVGYGDSYNGVYISCYYRLDLAEKCECEAS